VRRRLWTLFRAHYEVTRRLDFLGVGAAAHVLVGSERYVAGVAERRARLAGVVPLRDHGGDDVSRSAAGRAALGAVLSIASDIARVQLKGGCSSGGSTVTVAGEIMRTLKQFPTVRWVKIYDPQGNTDPPTGRGTPILECLEP
jgi:Fe-S cluster biogenesis protein NfuA